MLAMVMMVVVVLMVRTITTNPHFAKSFPQRCQPEACVTFERPSSFWRMCVHLFCVPPTPHSFPNSKNWIPKTDCDGCNGYDGFSGCND